jgi:hypothetical protein
MILQRKQEIHTSWLEELARREILEDMGIDERTSLNGPLRNCL